VHRRGRPCHQIRGRPSQGGRLGSGAEAGTLPRGRTECEHGRRQTGERWVSLSNLGSPDGIEGRDGRGKVGRARGPESRRRGRAPRIGSRHLHRNTASISFDNTCQPSPGLAEPEGNNSPPQLLQSCSQGRHRRTTLPPQRAGSQSRKHRRIPPAV